MHGLLLLLQLRQLLLLLQLHKYNGFACERFCIGARLTDEYMEIEEKCNCFFLFHNFLLSNTLKMPLLFRFVFCSVIHHFNFHLKVLYNEFVLLLLVYAVSVCRLNELDCTLKYAFHLILLSLSLSVSVLSFSIDFISTL